MYGACGASYSYKARLRIIHIIYTIIYTTALVGTHTQAHSIKYTPTQPPRVQSTDWSQ